MGDCNVILDLSVQILRTFTTYENSLIIIPEISSKLLFIYCSVKVVTYDLLIKKVLGLCHNHTFTFFFSFFFFFSDLKYTIVLNSTSAIF